MVHTRSGTNGDDYGNDCVSDSGRDSEVAVTGCDSVTVTVTVILMIIRRAKQFVKCFNSFKETTIVLLQSAERFLLLHKFRTPSKESHIKRKIIVLL